ncbi:DUF3592 domain-containing protein [Neisseria sp. Ec49-e6-T10]|uniref:DUF3592 domain-containing protein n=1 Tax=Neisseria sp. Ec49-e6-T10 TaxID=3140744 RepID=UPI003EBFE896
MNKILFFITKYFIWFIAISTLVTGVIESAKILKLNASKSTGIATIGTIYKKESDPLWKKLDIYCPKNTTLHVEYYTQDGKQYKSKVNGCHMNSLNSIGKKIDILYNPTNPQEFIPKAGLNYYYRFIQVILSFGLIGAAIKVSRMKPDF